MELSPAWRKVAFAVIVCVLAGLGAYLVGPGAHRPPGPTRSGPAPSGSVGATRAPVISQPSGATGQPDIYQWLPFTPAGLAAAAGIAVRFGNAYGTYSYTQDAAAYAATLQPLASAQLVGQIAAAYAAPGVASPRTSARQVAVAATTIASIRTFGPGSLTFVVQVVQQLTDSAGTSQQSGDYAETVTGAGTSWHVSDIELASAGNS